MVNVNFEIEENEIENENRIVVKETLAYNILIGQMKRQFCEKHDVGIWNVKFFGLN